MGFSGNISFACFQLTSFCFFAVIKNEGKFGGFSRVKRLPLTSSEKGLFQKHFILFQGELFIMSV